MDITDASEEEILALRSEGRAYAYALTHYAEATMEWLAYVDQHPRAKKADSAGEGR
jgi:hypothetical protein